MGALSFFGQPREEIEAGLDALEDQERDRLRDKAWAKYDAARPRGDISAQPAFVAGWAGGYRAAWTEHHNATWRSMNTAPKNATWVLLRVPCARKGLPATMTIVGHWADGGGDEQPRFRGWFQDTGYGFAEITPEPTGWMPLPKGARPA